MPPIYILPTFMHQAPFPKYYLDRAARSLTAPPSSCYVSTADNVNKKEEMLVLYNEMQQEIGESLMRHEETRMKCA